MLRRRSRRMYTPPSLEEEDLEHRRPYVPLPLARPRTRSQAQLRLLRQRSLSLQVRKSFARYL